MSESIGRVMDAVSKVKAVDANAFKETSLDSAKSQAQNIALRSDVLGRNVGEFFQGNLIDKKAGVEIAPDEIIIQEPTVEDVRSRMDGKTAEIRITVEELGSGALDKWNVLSEKAGLVGETDQVEALAKSKKIVTKNLSLRSAKDRLAENIIENVQEEGLNGPTSSLLGLTKESYISSLPFGDRDAARSEVITVQMLKKEPRFQAYRDLIVKQVQNLGETTKPVVDFKDIKGTLTNLVKKGGLKNIWSRANVATKFAFNQDAKEELYAHMDEAKYIGMDEEAVSSMPKLSAANEYLASFGDFQKEAQLTISSKAVLDAMPIASEAIQGQQKAILDQLIVDAYEQDGINAHDETFKSLDRLNDAYNENAIFDVEARKKELARLQAEMDKTALDIAQREAVAGAIKAKEQYLKEIATRDEFADLELKANQLVESSDKHAELASMGLTALHELQLSEKKIAEFNESFNAEQMPDALDSLVHGDMAKELQEFVDSNGKRGNDKAIRLLLVGAKSHLTPTDSAKGFFGDQQESAYQGMLEKVMFDPKNADHFLTLNKLTQVGNAKDVVETGIQAAVAEDGTWQLRFATRKDGTIAVNENIPVVNLKPESLFAALSTIDAQEASLVDAQKALTTHQERYSAAVAIKATSSEARKTAKGLVASSQLRVDELNKSLGVSRAALAKELKVTNTGSTLAEAFGEMAEAQKEVAQEFYSADFREMVSGLAKELEMPQDKVTAEVLATLVVEATNASEQAKQMAKYFNAVRTPGALEAHVVAEHMGEIDELSSALARLQRNEQVLSLLDAGPAQVKAAKEYKKERTALDNEAKSLGEMLNQAFIESVPAPLRKGTKATVISPTRFKQQVKETLDSAGIDSSKFLKRGGALVDRVRADLPYNTEIKVLTTQAADAMVGIENTEARRILLKALDEGDVQEFNEQVDNLTNHLTVEKVNVAQREADAAKLAELLRTPEGIAQAIETGELTIDGAVKAILDGAADPENVMVALSGKSEQVRNEAARRFYAEIANIDKQFNALSEADPLAGRPDVAAMAMFIGRQPVGQANVAQWQAIAERARAEKKTIAE